MSNKLYEETHIQNIANAIREKTGKTDLLLLSEMADEITNITGGGSGESYEYDPNGYLVTVFDYDGTILKERRLPVGAIFTLPEVPTHERLTFNSWSSTVNIVDNAITVPDYDVTIGSVYSTVSGASEFDVEITKAYGLTFSFPVTLTGVTSIDWGDGTTNTDVSHTYADYGKYTIKVYGMTHFTRENWDNDGTEIVGVLLSDSITTIPDNSLFLESLRYLSLPPTLTSIGTWSISSISALKHITFPNSLTEINEDSVTDNYALRSVVIPNTVTTIKDGAFASDWGLKYLCIPESVATIEESAFEYCYSLFSNISVRNITAIPNRVFDSCYSIPSLKLGDNITSIGDNGINACYALKNLKMPSKLTSIGRRGLNYTIGVEVYDFSSCETIPSLYDSYVIPNDYSMYKILVPVSLYDQWIATTNWSGYANYIYAV